MRKEKKRKEKKKKMKKNRTDRDKDFWQRQAGIFRDSSVQPSLRLGRSLKNKLEQVDLRCFFLPTSRLLLGKNIYSVTTIDIEVLYIDLWSLLA